MIERDADIARATTRKRAPTIHYTGRAGFISNFKSKVTRKSRAQLRTRDLLEGLEPEELDEQKSALPPDGDEDAGRKGSATKKKKGKSFEYVPLDHLNLIYELLQQFYGFSLLDEKEKQRFKRKERVLVDTPLFVDFGERELKKGRRNKEYRVMIDCRYLYRIKWWNGNGPTDCNAISLFIGEDGTRV